MATVINAGQTALTITPDTTGALTIQANGNNALQITSNGQITTANAPFILTGGQIQFPATKIASGDANTLDDYEEGTWTATLVPGTSGSITVNSSYNTGYYTKIGRQVFIHIYLTVSGVSSPVGRLRLNGLPFTVNANSPFAGTAYLVTTNAFTGVPWALSVAGSAAATIDRNAGTGADPSVDLANAVKTNTELYFSCTYYV